MLWPAVIINAPIEIKIDGISLSNFGRKRRVQTYDERRRLFWGGITGGSFVAITQLPARWKHQHARDTLVRGVSCNSFSRNFAVWQSKRIVARSCQKKIWHEAAKPPAESDPLSLDPAAPSDAILRAHRRGSWRSERISD
jgi:hypothetical protein